MQMENMSNYILRSLVTNVVWAFSGDGRLKIRMELSEVLRNATTIALPPDDSAPLIDYEVRF